MSDRRAHWETVWSGVDPTAVSWFQREPATSLALVDRIGLDARDPIVDVGGGLSPLAATLVRRGHREVTVVEIAQAALDALDASLTTELGAHPVHLVCADVLAWFPDAQFRLWHDRAVNHFLTEPGERRLYVERATATVSLRGHLVLAAFAPDGPDRCSGLAVHRTDTSSLAAEFADGFALDDVVLERHETPGHAIQPFQYLLFRRR